MTQICNILQRISYSPEKSEILQRSPENQGILQRMRPFSRIVAHSLEVSGIHGVFTDVHLAKLESV